LVVKELVVGVFNNSSVDISHVEEVEEEEEEEVVDDEAGIEEVNEDGIKDLVEVVVSLPV